MDNDKCHIKTHDCSCREGGSCVPFGAAWFELYDHQKGTINKERLFDQLCSFLTDTGKQMYTLVIGSRCLMSIEDSIYKAQDENCLCQTGILELGSIIKW